MTSDNIGTAEKGRRLAEQALRDRGMQTRELKQGNIVFIEARKPDGPDRVRVRVKTRTGGTWQGSTRDGDPDPPTTRPPIFWVFVDLKDPRHPAFYIAPDHWVRRDIHRAHSAYLKRHGGERAISKDSTHHAIEPRRLLEWRNRWDLLGS